MNRATPSPTIQLNRGKMNIGLIDVDGTRFPNLALGKIAAYHRSLGDTVEWVEPIYWDYDRVYQSKVFTFTSDIKRIFSCEVVKGGTGYDIHSGLPDEIDRLQPDYSIYPDIDSKYIRDAANPREKVQMPFWMPIPSLPDTNTEKI